MKTLNKTKNELKPKLLSSSIRVINTQPIKCNKIIKEAPNHLFSPIPLAKNHPVVDTKTTSFVKKPKSKDDKIIILTNRVPIAIKRNKIRPILDNESFIFQDKASINLNMSQSSIQSPLKHQQAPIDISLKSILPIATPQVFIPMPMQSNNNSLNAYHDQISNYLNYNLGDTLNLMQLQEIALESNTKKKEIVITDNNTPSTNEMEIELSKASIKLDSLIIGTKLHHQKQFDKANYANHIFSNNSVYNIDTNEYGEGEQKKPIYNLQIKENENNFKPEYCLTEFNLNNQTKPSLYNYPKKNRNNCNFRQIKTVDINHQPFHHDNNNESNQYFKKLPISNLNKANRSCFRIPKHKLI